MFVVAGCKLFISHPSGLSWRGGQDGGDGSGGSCVGCSTSPNSRLSSFDVSGNEKEKKKHCLLFTGTSYVTGPREESGTPVISAERYRCRENDRRKK